MSSIKVGFMICFVKSASNDCLGIDPRSDFIRHLSTCRYERKQVWNYPDQKYELGPPKWSNIIVTQALKGSSIAAISLVDTLTPLRLFYQDPELRVRDLFNRGGSEWYHGQQILALSLSMNESSFDYRFPGLWHTTAWNVHNS